MPKQTQNKKFESQGNKMKVWVSVKLINFEFLAGEGNTRLPELTEVDF
jgi:hypothetical protein